LSLLVIDGNLSDGLTNQIQRQVFQLAKADAGLAHI
jgi:hypothetical protein